jgi:hypothetical protein
MMMRTYPKRKEFDSLIVIKGNRFYDLITNTSIKVSSIIQETYTNPIAEACIQILEENEIGYIVAGSNNSDIAIYNH